MATIKNTYDILKNATAETEFTAEETEFTVETQKRIKKGAFPLL